MSQTFASSAEPPNVASPNTCSEQQTIWIPIAEQALPFLLSDHLICPHVEVFPDGVRQGAVSCILIACASSSRMPDFPMKPTVDIHTPHCSTSLAFEG